MTGPVFIGNFEPGSDEWNAARANGLGGSEMSAVLDLSPYESQYHMFHRKLGLVDGVEETEIMEAGKRLEPVILGKFRDRHPEWVVTSPAGTWTHPDRPWQIANPDALVRGRGPRGGALRRVSAIAEFKYSLYDDNFGAPGSDEIPVYYRCQVQHYLDVFGLDVCYLMVFVGSTGRFQEYVIEADPTDQLMLRDAGARFLARLAERDTPDIDAHNSTYSAIREMHPLIDPTVVELPAEIAVPYTHAKAAVKTAEEAAQLQTSRLAEFMANCKTAVFCGTTIADRRAKGGGTPYVQAARNLAPLPLELLEHDQMKEAS